MKPKTTSRNLARLAMITLLFFPVSFGNSFATQKAAKQKTARVIKHPVKVIELRNLEQLKNAFQRDTGKVRFVTILSPT